MIHQIKTTKEIEEMKKQFLKLNEKLNAVDSSKTSELEKYVR